MTDSLGAPLTVFAPHRPTWPILGIAALEAVQYMSTAYPSSLNATVVLWALLSGYLVWRIWRGGEVAWNVLLALVSVVAVLDGLAIFNVVHTGQSNQWAFWHLVLVAAELGLLLMPRVRRWVEQGRTA
ncbi:hypothetical protein ABH920_003297 [Catenulispora sp. EB89]|uniref:hypothetical protein n=1 Tax=Catenulispora sp. EB89 TaxID=3156257 RepID=UPI00351232B3